MRNGVVYSAELQSFDNADEDDLEDSQKSALEMDLEEEEEVFESQATLTKLHSKHTKYDDGRTSFSMSVFNLSNAIMGSGILGLSYALSNTGLVLFPLMLLSVTLLSLYSINLLLRCSKKEDCMVYEDLGFKAFGMPGKLAVFGSTFLQNIGAILSYMFIVKNEFPLVIKYMSGLDDGHEAWYVDGNNLIVIVTIAVILPLCLLKTLGYLGYTSGFSLGCMVFFLFVVIFKKFTLPCPGIELNVTLVTHNETCEESYISFNSKTIYALPTILFAYVCHPSVLPIYSELKDRSIKKMEAVSKVSFFSMFVMYLLTAVFGYLTFYSYVNDQLLHTYSRHDDILILIVRLAVFTAVILTVPVLFFVVRSSALELMKQKQFKWSLHIGVTFILLALCVLLVIFIPSIKDIFAVIGATSANMLIFILPAAIYLKLNDSLPFKKRIMPILFLTAGVISALITVPLVIIDWVHTVQNNETTAH